MRTMTDGRNRFVVFQDSGFEYGVKSTEGHHQAPYCAWKNPDGSVDEVVDDCGDGEKFHHATNDELLLKLAEENSDAARWLFSKGLTLDEPQNTVIELARADLSLGLRPPSAIDGAIVVYPLGREIAKLLESYGWRTFGMMVDTFAFHPDWPK